MIYIPIHAKTDSGEKPTRFLPFQGKIKESTKSKSKVVLGAWILLMLLTPFSLYLDYKCDNKIVPLDYFYSSPSNLWQLQSNIGNSTYSCTSDNDCGHGTCQILRDINGQTMGSHCVCDSDYTTAHTNDVCNYHMLSGLTVLLLSIFVGGCGIDRCFIARGNSCGICLGILKGVSCGGCGIWWLIDIILIATAQLSDGNNQPLSSIG
jgi:hypothetical protein